MAISASSLRQIRSLERVEFSSAWLRVLPSLGALALWMAELHRVELGRMNDYGLVSVLTPLGFAALAIITISFCLALREQPLRQELLLLHVIALIVMLFGVTAFLEQVPRFESTWKHVGVTDYVMRHGSVDPNIDAYFNWPGFFILLAFVTRVVGLSSPFAFANWTPLALELLYLLPLLMIFRRATDDRRLVWLAVWVFYLANWIGQDYLSPQGFNYFFYLVLIAILVTWFERASTDFHPIIRLARFARLPSERLGRLYNWVAPPDHPSAEMTPVQRTGLIALIIGIYAVIVIGHQLTPYAVLAATGLLVVTYRFRLVALPLVMLLLAGLWLRFGASAYWAGHGGAVTSEVGAVGSSVGANVTDRLSGSRGHEVVVYLRTASTAALWGLALIGGLRRLFTGHRDFTFGMLAIAPFPLVAAQSYGGEMVMRVYLFALPFMAFFAAAIFYRSIDRGASWYTTVALMCVCLAASGIFFVNRYGNERMDYFTPNEVAASTYVYDNAPPGSVIVVGTVKTPWRYRDYELHKYRVLSNEVKWSDPNNLASEVDDVKAILGSSRYNGGYLLITRSQLANDEMFGLFPVSLSELERAIQTSPDFTLVYENSDARVYVLTKQAGKNR